jgi:amino acid transporter
LNHERLILAMKKQDIPLSDLPWHNSWTGQCCSSSSLLSCSDEYLVYSTPVALGFCIIILLTNGFSVFTKGRWSSSTFVAAYL